MKFQNKPSTDEEERIINAIQNTFDEIDPERNIYPHNEIYFNTDDVNSNEIALLKFEFFPEVPTTEFGRGKSSLQMKEQFEAKLMDTLPENIKLERKNQLTFSFYNE